MLSGHCMHLSVWRTSLWNTYCPPTGHCWNSCTHVHFLRALTVPGVYTAGRNKQHIKGLQIHWFLNTTWRKPLAVETWIVVGENTVHGNPTVESAERKRQPTISFSYTCLLARALSEQEVTDHHDCRKVLRGTMWDTRTATLEGNEGMSQGTANFLPSGKIISWMKSSS